MPTRAKLQVKQIPKGGCLSEAMVDVVLVSDAGGVLPDRQHLSRLIHFLAFDIPNARCLTYEFEISLRDATIADEAGDLFQELRDVRGTATEHNPIIFIGFSLGGVIVKSALSRSDRNDPIVQSTRGVLFFDTPHVTGHSSAESFLRVFWVHFGIQYQQEGTFRLLAQRAREFRRVQEAFLVRAREFSNDIVVVSFIATQPLQGLKDNAQCSITLPEWLSFSVRGNPQTLHEFDSQSKPEYRQLIVIVKHIISSSTPESRYLDKRAESVDRAQKPCNLCERSQLDSTGIFGAPEESCFCRTIIPPIGCTYSWLWTNPEYLSWKKSPESSILWIAGGPGSGKSTLMRYLIDEFKGDQGAKGLTVMAHFFYHRWNAGTTPAAAGLLRSLLRQTMSQSCEPSGCGKGWHHEDAFAVWPNREDWLKELLRRFMLQATASRPVYFFIDGLDQLDPDDCRDLIAFFHGLISVASIHSLRICLSLRIPKLDSSSQGLQFWIQVDLKNRHDIQAYTQQQLAKYETNKDLKEKLIPIILGRANGIFQKAILDVSWLRYGHEPIADLQDVLGSLPTDLESVYKNVIGNLSTDILSSRTCVWILSWLALATRPLTLDEVHSAVLIRETLQNHDANLLTAQKTEHVLELLVNKTRGMVQIVDWLGSKGSFATASARRGKLKVRILQESFRGYLLVRLDAKARFMDDSRFKGIMHLQLAQRCLRYLSKLGAPEEGATLRDCLKTHPLIQYASSSWLMHLVAANAENTLPPDFQNFLRWPLKKAISTTSLGHYLLHLQEVPSSGTFQPDDSVNFLHLAAYHGLNKPISLYAENEDIPNIDARTKTGRTPLSFAMSRGHFEVARVFIKGGANISSKDYVFHNTVLHWAAYAPYNESSLADFSCILSTTRAIINDTSNGITPLALAAAHGSYSMVRLLLEHGADPNGRDQTRGQSALSLAIVHRHVQTAQTLLEHGALPDLPDERTKLTPLHHSIKQGFPELAFRLLDTCTNETIEKLPDINQNWLNRILQMLKSDVRQCPQRQTGRTGQDRGFDSASSASRASQSTASGVKRSRGTGGPQDSGDEEPFAKLSVAQKLPKDSSEADDEEYFCPFYVRDPTGHKPCASFSQKEVHRIKDHLYKKHLIYLCNRCLQIFKKESELNNHRDQVSCSGEPPSQGIDMRRDYLCGFDQRQRDDLRNRALWKTPRDKAAKIEYWRKMYGIVSPDVPTAEIPSPFIDPIIRVCDKYRSRRRLNDQDLINEIEDLNGTENFALAIITLCNQRDERYASDFNFDSRQRPQFRQPFRTPPAEDFDWGVGVFALQLPGRNRQESIHSEPWNSVAATNNEYQYLLSDAIDSRQSNLCLDPLPNLFLNDCLPTSTGSLPDLDQTISCYYDDTPLSSNQTTNLSSMASGGADHTSNTSGPKDLDSGEPVTKQLP